MAWQEAEGTKPPLEYDEDAKVEVPKEVLKTEEQQLNAELRGATLSRVQGEELGSKLGNPENPNEVFNSKTGYIKK